MRIGRQWKRWKERCQCDGGVHVSRSQTVAYATLRAPKYRHMFMFYSQPVTHHNSLSLTFHFLFQFAFYCSRLSRTSTTRVTGASRFCCCRVRFFRCQSIQQKAAVRTRQSHRHLDGLWCCLLCRSFTSLCVVRLADVIIVDTVCRVEGRLESIRVCDCQCECIWCVLVFFLLQVCYRSVTLVERIAFRVFAIEPCLSQK